MQHNITLPEEQYTSIDLHLLTKHDSLYAAGDTLNITLQGQREQKQFFIIRVLAKENKVNQSWCILLLNEENTAHS